MDNSAKLPNARLTSGGLLARNVVLNLLGSGAPMLVALICIPALVRELGKERFGILTLAWALIGYASLFELGLGRALTQLVAQKLGIGEEHDVPRLAWTSLVLMLLLGTFGAIVIALISPWLVGHALKVPAALQQETLLSFRVLALSLPFVVTTAGLRGLLEAHQRFGLANSLRIPIGIFTYAGPLAALLVSRSLVIVVATLAVGRIAAWAAHIAVCLRVFPELRASVLWDRSVASPLLRFGGWMSVTNVVGPLMVTMDRFVIGGLLSMMAVAYYATPYEVVTKILLIPAALTGVMFPAFSASLARDSERTAVLFRGSVKAVFLMLFPLVLCIIVLAQDGLTVWLGADFAQHSFRVAQLLALGVFINSFAQVPFALLQSASRPDLTAKLHLLELPFYLGLLWWLISTHGIEGAALAWTARVSLDAALLFLLAAKFLPGRSMQWRSMVMPATTLLILGAAALVHGRAGKLVFLLTTVFAFLLISWFRLLTPEERMLTQRYSRS